MTFDESKVLPEQKLYDVTIMGCDYQTFSRLKLFAETLKLVNEFKENIIPENLPKEMVTPFLKKVINFRKSPKSKK